MIVRRFCLAAILCMTSTSNAAPRTPWTTSRIQGTPEQPLPYEVAPVYAKPFQRPVTVMPIPGRNLLLVAEIGGRFLTLDKSAPTDEPKLVFDARSVLPETTRGRGVTLFDFTFHPQFEENGLLYFVAVQPTDEPATHVTRVRASNSGAFSVDATSARTIIRWRSGGHNGACLRFGPDGMLYISAGDGVGPNPPDSLGAGQDVSNLLATVMRINVDVDENSGSERAYKVPGDNPFVDTAGARPEIWAYGFRNPWRMDFDLERGDLWLADVGWETWEMVHRVVRGGNYGWSHMEGRMRLRSEVEPGPTPILPPVKDHPRSEANSVTGGVVYRGEKFPDLRGAFVYGDYVTGKIWALRRGEGDEYTHKEIADTRLRIIAFAQDDDGEIYVLDHDYDQRLYRLTPAPAVDKSREFPRLLSQTGLYRDTAARKLAAGVVPYSVVAGRWLDGAEAERAVGIPGSASITYTDRDDSTPWTFPEGSVFAKTVLLPSTSTATRPVETQILHYERGSWRPYTYAWNADRTDAELVDAAGQTVALENDSEGRMWRHGGRAECTLCHNAPVGGVLGFEPAQLNTSTRVGGVERPQIAELLQLGVINWPRFRFGLVDPHDAREPLEERARSYLHVNCGVCHNHGGDSTVTIFFQRKFDLRGMNALRPPGVGRFGVDDPHILRPGDPFGSIMLYRMSKLGYARMPHVGTRVVDSRGVDLIRQWIASLGESSSQTRDSQAIDLLGAGNLDDDAVRTLVETTRGALAAVNAVHRGDVVGDARKAIVSAGAKSARTDISGLFETFIPESARRKTLGPSFDPAAVLNTPGDATRGRLIFLSDQGRCRTCHPVAGEGEPLGPDLKGVGSRYPPGEMLRHLVEPSRKIDPQYATYVLVTTDGSTHTGLQVKNTPEVVELRTVEKKLVSVERAKIAFLEEQQSKSLMPELLLRDLTAGEAADLLAYLLSLK